MTILLFLFGVAVAAGLFFILADILKLPRLSTEKALLSAGRAEKKRMKSLDAIFLGWAIKLSKFIRMDEYKRHRMERTLSAAGMDMTPEVYLAYTILKPAAALLVVIPCLLIFPLLSPIVVLLAILGEVIHGVGGDGGDSAETVLVEIAHGKIPQMLCDLYALVCCGGIAAVRLQGGGAVFEDR